jgi:hypothetical protein
MVPIFQCSAKDHCRTWARVSALIMKMSPPANPGRRIRVDETTRPNTDHTAKQNRLTMRMIPSGFHAVSPSLRSDYVAFSTGSPASIQPCLPSG